MIKIKELGEFGLIELLKKMTKSLKVPFKGIGDDCAVLPFSPKKYLLFTSDMLIEDVDFRRSDSPYLVGRKSIGCCLSDIAACGGLPLYAQISLGLSPNMSLSKMKQLYRGIISQAEKFRVKVVGGDISRSDKLVIDVSLIGMVEKKNLVLRQGARKADIIFVSGRLGGSIYGRHLSFTPRIKEARYLVRNYKINSMIDISDGLLQDLGHILEEANLGAFLFKDLIPLSDDARSFNEALSMGEDFELLFTLALKEAKRLVKSRQKNKFFPIGKIVSKTEGLVLLNKHARKIRFKSSGFKHF